MRVFALSDVHVDYEANARWVAGISAADYLHDVLILAGDITDKPKLFQWCLTTLAKRFRKVLLVPGNHDLWVIRDVHKRNSLEKFSDLERIVESSGGSMCDYHENGVSIIPLFGWYDYSFGEPSDELKMTWADYYACRWPAGFHEKDVADHFESLNTGRSPVSGNTVITFSHFMPRIDLIPPSNPASKRILYPVLGTIRLERQLRLQNPKIHVYGHSHVNGKQEIDGVTYINNALGYPDEASVTSKRLLSIHER
jgi:predicted phosphodiesterase